MTENKKDPQEIWGFSEPKTLGTFYVLNQPKFFIAPPDPNRLPSIDYIKALNEGRAYIQPNYEHEDGAWKPYKARILVRGFRTIIDEPSDEDLERGWEPEHKGANLLQCAECRCMHRTDFSTLKTCEDHESVCSCWEEVVKP